jgi:hypothetical protein
MQNEPASRIVAAVHKNRGQARKIIEKGEKISYNYCIILQNEWDCKTDWRTGKR